ncbi:hypothetical protein PGTUg99_004545 [Puccinia graminis f. sp. tritici]|uniref:Uncharacterized protein n=1 Tax=Puccinia graminis f. sp. tritici TaxID=56615 RepID=A0A5B0NBQ7_PUCGR|nr:hypothetical protein PGTUg99_004545 [Puccinia graminis f. sp. tritici]
MSQSVNQIIRAGVLNNGASTSFCAPGERGRPVTNYMLKGALIGSHLRQGIS